MKLNDIIETLEKGDGISKQKVMTFLREAKKKKKNIIGFIEFASICKHYHQRFCLLGMRSATIAFAGDSKKGAYLSVCSVDYCPLWDK